MNPQTRTHSAAATAAPTELVLDVGPVAHGGHCVARHEGRVVFVRHGVPGEKVRARLTDAGESAKFWRADVVEVMEASPDRVEHFWRPADSLRAWAHGHPPVGGAEFGHISLARQRALKSAVLAEQLQRLAAVERLPEGLDLGNLVEAVDAGGPDSGQEAEPKYDAGTGLGWRTRASFSVTPGGKLGMHAHRSDHIIPVREMPLATERVNRLRLWDLDLTGIERVEVAAPSNGSRPLVLLAPAPGTKPKRLSAIAAQLPDDVSVATFDPLTGEVAQLRGRTWVQESAAGHDFRVTGAGFWQIHRDAPGSLWGPSQNFSTMADFWHRVPWWPTFTPAPGCSRLRWLTRWGRPGPFSRWKVRPEPAVTPVKTSMARRRWRSSTAGWNVSSAKSRGILTPSCWIRPGRAPASPWSAN